MFIKVNKLSLMFRIYSHNSKSLKNSLINKVGGMLVRNTSDESVSVEALSSITFDLKKNDRLGLLGHNGSGKTSLLRVLSSVYEPTFGEFKSCGKVLPLINLLNGFDDVATGYENIYLKSLLLGVNYRDIKNNLPFIEEFSELGNFLNLPLRSYSSGMKMRLAFSIAMTVNFDILLLDEWLSVGDHDFQIKSEKLIKSRIKNRILVLASHSEELLKRICNKIIVLDKGKIVKVKHV